MICQYVAACFKQRSCCIPETARLWLAICAGSIFFLLESTASADSIHVDNCSGGSGAGSQSNPHTSLATAVTAATPGDTITLLGGAYRESLIITKPLIITATAGSALIGEYYAAATEVCIPQIVSSPSGNCNGGNSVNAKIYYPSRDGQEMACGGPFPSVVYTHGFRRPEWELCDWSQPGEVHEDYRQAERMLHTLAAAGIIGISADSSPPEPDPWIKGKVILETLVYLRNQNELSGSLLGSAIDKTRVGLAGHSSGGAASVWAALVFDDPLFDDLNLDEFQIRALGLIAPGRAFEVWFEMMSQEPAVLVIHGTNEHPDQANEFPIDDYKAALRPKHLIVVEGANHFGYTDGICLEPDDGKDNPSEVGGVADRQAHGRQQVTARNYVHAFFSHYLQGAGSLIDHLVQNQGEQCGPGVPLECGRPRRSFENLDAINVEVDVCSCTQ